VGEQLIRLTPLIGVFYNWNFICGRGKCPTLCHLTLRTDWLLKHALDICKLWGKMTFTAFPQWCGRLRPTVFCNKRVGANLIKCCCLQSKIHSELWWWWTGSTIIKNNLSLTVPFCECQIMILKTQACPTCKIELCVGIISVLIIKPTRCTNFSHLFLE